MLSSTILHRVQQLSRMREILDHFDDSEYVERWMDATALYEMFDPEDAWNYWRTASDEDCFREALQLFVSYSIEALKQGVSYRAAIYEYWYSPCYDPEMQDLFFGSHDPAKACEMASACGYKWIAICLDNKADPGVFEVVPVEELIS